MWPLYGGQEEDRSGVRAERDNVRLGLVHLEILKNTSGNLSRWAKIQGKLGEREER